MSFFSELKRRNVIRVGILYLVAAWLAMQVADVSTSILDLPDWIGRLIFLLLAMGLPIALVASWIFELTPDGIKLDKNVPAEASVSHTTARKLDVAVTALLIIALLAIGLDRLVPEQAEPADTVSSTEATPHNSIAVMPFVNMSPDANNVYFSDGLSEELLNLLAKIPELRVAARTSAFALRDSNIGIREIGGKLNVAHVLEGSVRKSGSKIRITAQLINANDGYHLWSETWDRDLVDVFAIQDEIAAAVVNVLRLELLGDPPRAYETDVEAFELGLKARAAAARFTREGLEEAQALATEAIAIDPNYADAWYGLSIVYSNMVSQDIMTASDGFSKARAAAMRALEIDPLHARSLSSLGWIAMFWERDMDKAARYMQRALELAPGDPRVLNAYGTLQSAYGRNDQTIEYYGRALSRDPLSVPVLANLALEYMNTGSFEEARALVERIRGVDPESYMLDRSIAWLNMSEGNYEDAIIGFEALPGLMGDWGLALSYYGLGDIDSSDDAIAALGTEVSSLVAVAGAYAHRGENDKAFDFLQRAVESDSDAVMEIRMYPAFSRVHDDPRWQALLEQLGLSDADAERLGL